MQRGHPTFPSNFKFMSVWLQHSDYTRLVSETWKQEFSGCPMFILSQKLKASKSAFKVWNKKTFGDVHMMVSSAQDKLDLVQQQISECGYFDLLHDEEDSAHKELQIAIGIQEEFWRETLTLLAWMSINLCCNSSRQVGSCQT